MSVRPKSGMVPQGCGEGGPVYTRGKGKDAVPYPNAKLAQDIDFVGKCLKAGVRPTRRQASKYRNERGLAWRGVHGVKSD
jgi:hypothetical protein